MSRNASIRPNEITIPTLHTHDPEATLAFYETLGFTVVSRQLKPYVYLAFELSGLQVHFSAGPRGMDPTTEMTGGCLVMVDHVAPYHSAFTEAMRAAHGKVLSRGLPRITRYRPGASRFTLVDPSGNSLIFIQRDEPEEVEYGGSAALEGLAKALDQVRIYREFKTDDAAAYRRARSALKRHGETASALERATAHAVLVELATALDRADEAEEWRRALAPIMAEELTEDERRVVREELERAADLVEWRDE